MSDILGKVAKILNSRELVINVGSNKGVIPGMIFNVLDPSGEDIIDPDTGKPLGSLRRKKLQVRVTTVYTNMAVAITFKKSTHNFGNAAIPARRSALDNDFSSLARWLTSTSTATKEETLKRPDGVYEHLDEKDSYVKIGDIVELEQPSSPDN